MCPLLEGTVFTKFYQTQCCRITCLRRSKCGAMPNCSARNGTIWLHRMERTQKRRSQKRFFQTLSSFSISLTKPEPRLWSTVEKRKPSCSRLCWRRDPTLQSFTQMQASKNASASKKSKRKSREGGRRLVHVSLSEGFLQSLGSCPRRSLDERADSEHAKARQGQKNVACKQETANQRRQCVYRQQKRSFAGQRFDWCVPKEMKRFLLFLSNCQQE